MSVRSGVDELPSSLVDEGSLERDHNLRRMLEDGVHVRKAEDNKRSARASKGRDRSNVVGGLGRGEAVDIAKEGARSGCLKGVVSASPEGGTTRFEVQGGTCESDRSSENEEEG